MISIESISHFVIVVLTLASERLSFALEEVASRATIDATILDRSVKIDHMGIGVGQKRRCWCNIRATTPDPKNGSTHFADGSRSIVRKISGTSFVFIP